MTQTIESLKRLVNKCSYGNWKILLRLDDDRPYVQIKFEDACAFSGVVEEQSCRKWMLSYHMCDSEVIQTVYAAIERAVIHEAKEKFKFENKTIFNPHRSVYSLLDICTKEDIDIR